MCQCRASEEKGAVAHVIKQQLVKLAVAQLVSISHCRGHHRFWGFAKAGGTDGLDLGLFGHPVENIHLDFGRDQVSCMASNCSGFAHIHNHCAMTDLQHCRCCICIGYNSKTQVAQTLLHSLTSAITHQELDEGSGWSGLLSWGTANTGTTQT